jgi:type II secretory pathway pseudopilin PulG
MNRFLMRIRARVRDGEEGFTIVELMVALSLIVVLLVALAYTATIAFSDVALARQRQSANGLASQVIEEVRALPFDTLKKGLSSNDPTIATDTNITACGTDKCYKSEPIPMSGYASGTTIQPLVNHRQTITVGPTAYTVRTYVTYYQSNKTSNTFRVTALVSWTATERAKASHKVEVQTVVFSPSGCLSTATHPFAAPCQPFLYSTATSDQGHIDITGSILTVPTWERASVWLAGEDTSQQIEQTSSVQGLAYTSGVSRKDPNVDETFQGVSQINSGADNDPTSPGNDFQAVTGTQPALSAISSSGALGSLTLTGSAGDTTSTASTTSGTASHPCPNASGVNQTDGQPCGDAKSLQAGTLQAVYSVVAGASDLGSATLVQLLPPAATSPGFSFTNRDITPEATMCATTSADGCIHADATRTLGQLTLATLPVNVSVAPLTGWAGYYVRVTSMSDSVTSESGVGSAAPTATAAGSISFYNGSGYTTCALYGAHTGACALSNGNFQIPAVTLNDPAHAGVTISLTASLAPGATSVTSTVATCSPACPNTRTDSNAKSPSPILGTVHYVVSMGVTLADLTTTVNLGTLQAKTSYQAAPLA